jgi:hypothetical protein
MITELGLINIRGKIITCTVCTALSVTILTLSVNFNPYPHFDFFNQLPVEYIKLLTGVKVIDFKGEYAFVIDPDFNRDKLMHRLKVELDNYFKT